MRISSPVLFAVFAMAALVACSESVDTLSGEGASPGRGGEPTTGEAAAGGRAEHGDGGGDGGAGPFTPSDGGSSDSSPLDAPSPACTPGLTSVTLTLPSVQVGPLRAAPMPDEGTMLAWGGGGGKVYVRRIDRAGGLVGVDRTVSGVTVHGVAPMPDGVALLVARSPDVLAIVKLTDGGAVAFDRVLVGNQDHAQIGSEWFSYEPQFFAQAGRLVWNGSRLFAYAPIYRHFDDGISHTGDTLRVFDGADNAAPGGWTWGCSHSLDVRLSADGKKPVCLSDCYPQKGILVSRQSLVSSEPSGNCAGRSDAKLGGIATIGGATWLTFASREGRSSRDVALVKLGESTTRWLTSGPDATAPSLARYGAQLLAGWRFGADARIQVLDAQGAAVGSEQDVSALPFGEGSDFLSWPGGDAGWLVQSGKTVKVARLGACD